MSRYKLFFMIFLTFVLVTISSVLLLHQWYGDYQDEILKPVIKKELQAYKSAIEVFAFRKMRSAEKHARWSFLRDAFQAKEKRSARIYQELSALHAKKAMRSASMLMAATVTGKAFARTGSQVVWKGADWSSLTFLKMAGRGLSSYRMMRIEKNPYLVVAAPIWEQEDPRKKKPRKTVVDNKTRLQCPRSTRYRCRNACLVWNPSTGSCQKESDEKSCGCFGRGVWKQVKFPPIPNQIKSVKPTSCPAKSSYQCRPFCLRYNRRKNTCRRFAKRPFCACFPTPKAKEGSVKRTGLQKKILGVLLVAYRIDKSWVSLLQRRVNKNVPSPTELLLISEPPKKTRNILGTSLSGMEKAMASMILTTAEGIPEEDLRKARLLLKGDSNNNVLLGLDRRSFLAMSANLEEFGLKHATLIVFRPMTQILNLSKEFVLNFALLALAAFLFLLLLIFPASNRFFRDLEMIELKIFESANTRNWAMTFHEHTHSQARSLASALDMLYRRLRGESEPEDQAPDAIQWDALIDESEPAISSTTHPSGAHYKVPTSPVVMQRQVHDSANLEQQERERLTRLVQAYRHREEEHYEDVLRVYRDALESLGRGDEVVDGKIFIDKLRENAEQYKSEYLCEVYFDVVVEQQQVVLKPLLIPGDIV